MITRLRRSTHLDGTGARPEPGGVRQNPRHPEPVETGPRAEDEWPVLPPVPALPPLPLPADGLAALQRLLHELTTRCGNQGAAARSLLAGLHRSLVLLAPGYPAHAAPAELWGFSPAPAGHLDELDAQLNRLEEVLLQLLPATDGESA